MSDVKVTRSVCSNLFVAFVSDPLDLDLFPPHVSAVAVGGAKGGGVVTIKGDQWRIVSLSKTSGSLSSVLPVHAGQAQSRRGWRRRRRGRRGLGVWRLPQIMVPWVGPRSSAAQAEPGSRALPFTSAQQLLKKQQGDAGVYLFPLTHFSYYKHLVCLRPGRTGAQSGIPGAVQSHAAMRGRGGGVHVCAGGLWCRAGAPQGPTWREAVLRQLH